MAKNKIQEGAVLSITAPAAYVSGQLVLIGALVGVALHSCAQGADVSIDTEGVYELPKKDAADDIALGAPVFATATGQIDKESTAGNVLAGYAVAAAGAGTTTVLVRLFPSGIVV